MENEISNLIKHIEKGKDQLWVVRIAPRNNGLTERWIISPVSRKTKNTPKKRLLEALKAIKAESKESEIWDCRYVKSGSKVSWVCDLKKRGMFTKPKGYVFDIG